MAELQTPEGRLGNAKRVVACLDSLGLNYGLTVDSLLKGAAPDLLLLTLHLQMVSDRPKPQLGIRRQGHIVTWRVASLCSVAAGIAPVHPQGDGGVPIRHWRKESQGDRAAEPEQGAHQVQRHTGGTRPCLLLPIRFFLMQT